MQQTKRLSTQNLWQCNFATDTTTQLQHKSKHIYVYIPNCVCTICTRNGKQTLARCVYQQGNERTHIHT